MLTPAPAMQRKQLELWEFNAASCYAVVTMMADNLQYCRLYTGSSLMTATSVEQAAMLYSEVIGHDLGT